MDNRTNKRIIKPTTRYKFVILCEVGKGGNSLDILGTVLKSVHEIWDPFRFGFTRSLEVELSSMVDYSKYLSDLVDAVSLDIGLRKQLALSDLLSD